MVALAALGTHAMALRFGLRADDYLWLNPFTRTAAREVLAGGLSGAYFSGLFWLFGLHAWPMHLIAIIELAAVAYLLALFLWRDHGVEAAAIGALLYLLHPLLPDSTSAWITSHTHLLALGVVAAALVVWQSRRHDPTPGSWARIFTLTIIGAFISEDTVVILPAILLLQWTRSRVVRDVPSPTQALLAAACAVVLGLAIVRVLLFPHASATPAETRAWLEIVKGTLAAPLHSAFVLFGGGAWAIAGTVSMISLQVAAAWRARQAPASASSWLWIAGLILLSCFALPLLFAPDAAATRLHLEVFSAACMLTAGACTMLDWVRTASRGIAALAIAVLLATATSLGIEQRLALRRFTACSAEDLSLDQTARSWGVRVSDDILRWLDVKAEACAAGRYQPLEQVMTVMRWSNMDGHTLLVRKGAHTVGFALGMPGSAEPGANSIIRVTIDGIEHTVTLRPDERTTVSYRLRDNELVATRSGHRIDIASVDGDAPMLSGILVDGTSAR